MGQPGRLAEAGPHQVVGLLVIGDGGGHAAHQGQMLHLLGDVRQVLADLDARRRGGDRLVGAALVAPFLMSKVQVWRRPAAHEQNDARLGRLALACSAASLAGDHVEPAGNAGAQRPDAGQLQHIAPGAVRSACSGGPLRPSPVCAPRAEREAFYYGTQWSVRPIAGIRLRVRRF